MTLIFCWNDETVGEEVVHRDKAGGVEVAQPAWLARARAWARRAASGFRPNGRKDRPECRSHRAGSSPPHRRRTYRRSPANHGQPGAGASSGRRQRVSCYSSRLQTWRDRGPRAHQKKETRRDGYGNPPRHSQCGAAAPDRLHWRSLSAGLPARHVVRRATPRPTCCCCNVVLNSADRIWHCRGSTPPPGSRAGARGLVGSKRLLRRTDLDLSALPRLESAAG